MKRLLAFALAVGLAAAGALPAAAQQSDNDVETQIGQQEYQALQKKGEIISSSPYYAILNPIAQQIKRVADRQYYHPFTFILVHESQPNAFAVPGGNVYVTDSLMKFVQNREELAGVLCHETSHDIHHDVLNLYKKEQRVGTTYTIGDVLANILTGGRAANVIGTVANIGFNLQSLGFSREVERNADLKGADTCAEAGSNPWGMVWLFQAFDKAAAGGQMEMLSDHPSDEHRIAELEDHFREDPALFAHWSSNQATATPLSQAARGSSSLRGQKAAYRAGARKGMFRAGSGYKY